MGQAVDLIIQSLVQQGFPLADAYGLAIKYACASHWEPMEDGLGWIINLPIVINHARPWKDESGKEWRGQEGSLHGLVIHPEFRDGLFLVAGETFSPGEIVEWWIKGNSLEFYRPGFGWVELEHVYHLPPSLPQENKQWISIQRSIQRQTLVAVLAAKCSHHLEPG